MLIAKSRGRCRYSLLLLQENHKQCMCDKIIYQYPQAKLCCIYCMIMSRQVAMVKHASVSFLKAWKLGKWFICFVICHAEPLGVISVTEGVPFEVCFSITATPVGSDFIVNVIGNGNAECSWGGGGGGGGCGSRSIVISHSACIYLSFIILTFRSPFPQKSFFMTIANLVILYYSYKH